MSDHPTMDATMNTITSSTTTTTSTNTNNSSSTSTNRIHGGISQLSTTHRQTTFRNMSMNSIAVVPLLCNDDDSQRCHSTTTHNHNNATTNTLRSVVSHSTQSYHEFMSVLQQHPYSCHNNSSSSDSLSDSASHNNHNHNYITLVVPNHTLTRPSDWKYETTPFHSFHWNDGCQRLMFHDGRSSSSSSSSSTASHNNNNNNHTNDPSLYYHYTASSAYRNYIDLYPHRRTAAIIGILNIQDCIVPENDNSDQNNNDTNAAPNMTTAKMIQRACEELQQWSHRYSSPSYGASTYGHTSSSSSGKDHEQHHRDVPVTRLFVYDSFNIDTPEMIFDIQQTQKQTILFDTNSIIAFPPTTVEHQAAMMLHYNLVLSDLMVTIFRHLEQKVVHATRCIHTLLSDPTSTASTTTTTTTTTIPPNHTTDSTTTTTGLARRSLARFVSTTTSTTAGSDTTRPPVTLGVNQLADLVDPDSVLAKTSPRNTIAANTFGDVSGNATAMPVSTASATTKPTSSSSSSSGISMSKLFQLLTPLDDELMMTVLESPTTIGPKDVEALKKREMGRRYKYIGDLCLLAGTPLDAYEHYLKAMELCKSGSGGGSTSTTISTPVHDPLWYAATLEACAVAHIVMAEIGGYGYV